MITSSSLVLPEAKLRLAAKIIDVESVLHLLSITQSQRKTKEIHARAITSGILFCPEIAHVASNTFSINPETRRIRKIRTLFTEFYEKITYLYNKIMRAYSNNSAHFDVLQVFVKMSRTAYCSPDNYSFPFIIKACSELMLHQAGHSVHGMILVRNFSWNSFIANSLLAMYMNFWEEEHVHMIFEEMEKTLVSWNTMLYGYLKNGYPRVSLIIFNRLLNVELEIDQSTVTSVLPACGQLQELESGKKIHALSIVKGLDRAIEVKNALVDMYVKCGSMFSARSLFDTMTERDVISWTSLINGYLLNSDSAGALSLCRSMQIKSVTPNVITLSSLLSGCASFENLKHGRSIHGWIIRRCLDSEVNIETSLIDMYANCNHLDLSYKIFSRTPKKRTVPWNAMLAGCMKHGFAAEAILLFKKVLPISVKPDTATMNSLLPAYALLADFDSATSVHCYLVKLGLDSKTEVVTGLVHVYAKCGSLNSALKMFNSAPIYTRDSYSWSVIISGFGQHGDGEMAVSLFTQMIEFGFEPNEVTFTCVLHACSHCGLVDQGLALFKLMCRSHKSQPNEGHYTCIVDMLGRSGRLNEAYDLIRTMPFKAGHAVWGALLGACVIHENLQLGEIAAHELIKLEPKNTGNYVLLSRLYRSVGRWKDAETVRQMIDNGGLRKPAAQSIIDVRGG